MSGAAKESLKSIYASYIADRQSLLLGTAAALALAYAVYCAWRREKEIEKMALRFDCQTLELPGPEHIRVNARTPQAISVSDLPVKTVHELFLTGVKLSGDRPFLGWRTDESSEYTWATYNEIHTKAKYLGSALYELGYRREDLIGICAQNKPQWVIVDQGAMMFSMVLVPLYETLGLQGMEYIMEETEISIMFCDASKVDTLLSATEKSSILKTIIVFDALENPETLEMCQKREITILTMDNILELGKMKSHEKMPPSPKDLAIICYTSGTTGNPKGVMLTHGSLAANAYISHNYALEGVMTQDDSMISYLPLGHMFERMAEYIAMSVGAKIGYFRGNVKELVKDIQVLRPTIFASVPRLLNAMHDKIMGEVSKSSIKSFLMNMAISSKTKDLKRGVIRNNTFWDALIFKKIQGILGGNVRLMISGSAPLSSKVRSFLICAFGCPVKEGYGQTELCAVATITSSLDPMIGHVGPPIPGCRMKLVDVPDLDYFAIDGKGEICLQGPNVFSGYFKNEEKTNETLDEQGWCHTGDIGRWLPNGALTIIDRKKHIFKLSQGEYIAPEKIESIYLQSPLVAQVYVTGNSLQPCTVAVAAPDPEPLMRWASSQNIKGTMEELCKNKEVVDAVLESMRSAGDSAGLNGLEQVKAVFLIAEQFSIENGLLTPTMKMQRKKVENLYSPEINSLYDTLVRTNQIKPSSCFK